MSGTLFKQCVGFMFHRVIHNKQGLLDGSMVYHPHVRRLEILTIYRPRSSDSMCWSGKGSNPQPPLDQLAQLVEHWTTVREVTGSNPGQTNTQGF